MDPNISPKISDLLLKIKEVSGVELHMERVKNEKGTEVIRISREDYKKEKDFQDEVTKTSKVLDEHGILEIPYEE